MEPWLHLPLTTTWSHPLTLGRTMSQLVGIILPGAGLGTCRSIDTVVLAPEVQPDVHCQWDLMLLPFLPPQPNPDPYFTPRYAGATTARLWLDLNPQPFGWEPRTTFTAPSCSPPPTHMHTHTHVHTRTLT